MPTALLQSSFTGGEISPALYARTDLARYATSLRTCRNFLVRPYGGVDNRPGTRFIAEVKDSSAAVRLLKFSFSADQNYVLEFGDLYIRIYRDGAQLASGGSPVEVVTPYATADLDRLRFVQSADVMTLVHPDHAPRELRRYAEDDWRLTVFNFQNGPFKDLNTNVSEMIWASAATGEVTIYASADIFTADHVGALLYLESRNLTAVPPWEGNKQIAYDGANPYGEKRRNADGNVYRCVTNQAAGAGEEIRTGNIEPTHTKGVASDGDGNAITAGTTTYAERAGVAWEYLHSGFGILHITDYVSPTEVRAEVISRLPDSVVSTASLSTLATIDGDGSTTTFSVPGATSDDPADYQVIENIVIVKPGGEIISESSRVMGTDEYAVTGTTTDQITFDVAPSANATIWVQAFVGGNNTDIWAFGAWSEVEGYPSVVTYFGDRLTFASTPAQPQTVWMSKTGNYPDFGESRPLVDDDAITFTINARQINEIRELLPLSDMVLLTAGGEWRMLTSEGLVAPSTISVRPQSYRGVADLPAVIIGNTALYVQAQGAAIRDLFYTFAEDGYNGNDLTLLADHLFAGHSITAIDFHQVPYSVLWAVRDDGALLSLTYMREQEVIGWARHDTGDGDAFEDVCVIPEGDEDACYVVVRRTIDGATKRYIERFATRRIGAIEDAVFVDCSLAYDGENTEAGDTLELSSADGWTVDDTVTVTATGHAPFSASSVGDQVWLRAGDDEVRVQITGYTSGTVVTGLPLADVPAALQDVAVSDWTLAVDTLSGLDHLEGRTVAVLADGNVQDQKTVSGGSITLDRPAGKVQVGLPIEADFETLEVNVAGGETVRNKKKVIPRVSLVVRASRGIWAGTDADHLYEAKVRNEEGYLEPVALLTGAATIPISSTWNNTGRVFVRQSDPLPLSILGVIPEVEFGG